MVIKKFVVGPLETNCYIFADEDSKEAALIDPGGSPEAIKDYIKKNGLNLKYIINTHGHGDHIGANSYFSDTDVLIHKSDADFLGDPGLNLSSTFGFSITAPKASRLLSDGDRIKVGKLELEAIHTPGHTPGGICLRYQDTLFSGDTLFFEGVGRTDLPEGSWDQIRDSIKNKLMGLPDNCHVYPGHGPETTIGHERKYNTFLK